MTRAECLARAVEMEEKMKDATDELRARYAKVAARWRTLADQAKPDHGKPSTSRW